MKTVLLLAALLLPLTLRAADEPKAPQPTTVMVHAMIFSVPKPLAADLLSSPEIKSDPAAVLKRVKKLVADHKAFYIANPSLNSTVGNRAVSDSLATLEVEAKLSPEDRTTGHLVVFVSYGKQRMTTSSPFRLGATLFLGSVDPSVVAPPQKAPSTHLVFLHVQ